MKIIETNLKFGSMTKRSKTERIILHHAAASSCSAEQIHSWHLKNAWAGAGYHFLVRKDGSIYRLRPEEYVGAHARGSNYNSIGICAEGNFENETMSNVQKNSLIELVSYIKGKYGISKVQRHKDVGSTACPGRNYPFDEIATAKTSSQNTSTNVCDGNPIIKSIQTKLNDLYKVNLVADGISGPLTKKGLVKGLQIEFNNQLKKNLVTDGIFGLATKKACPSLSVGAKGNITWLVQAMLYIKGYSITIDGLFGTNTKNIVISFQKANGLTADGIVGPNTFEKLFK